MYQHGYVNNQSTHNRHFRHGWRLMGEAGSPNFLHLLGDSSYKITQLKFMPAQSLISPACIFSNETQWQGENTFDWLWHADRSENSDIRIVLPLVSPKRTKSVILFKDAPSRYGLQDFSLSRLALRVYRCCHL